MPQPIVPLRPARTTGIPGIVPPITPPDSSSSRARYQIAGAVNPKCGSLARIVPPVAERVGAAAQALEAPPSPRAGTGCSEWRGCDAAA